MKITMLLDGQKINYKLLFFDWTFWIQTGFKNAISGKTRTDQVAKHSKYLTSLNALQNPRVCEQDKIYMYAFIEQCCLNLSWQKVTAVLKTDSEHNSLRYRGKWCSWPTALLLKMLFLSLYCYTLAIPSIKRNDLQYFSDFNIAPKIH